MYRELEANKQMIMDSCVPETLGTHYESQIEFLHNNSVKIGHLF